MYSVEHDYIAHTRKLQEQKRRRFLGDVAISDLAKDFSHNDYLGLSRCHTCLEAGYKTAKEYGIGATGSRILSGNTELIMALEKEIAQAKRCDRALVFPSGYQANTTILPCLWDRRVVGENTLVLMDRSCHASMYDAVLSSGVLFRRFSHNDVQQLRSILCKERENYRTVFLLVESVYSMDGDKAPLVEYCALAKEFGMFLYIDEAHATGMFGEKGYGCTTETDVQSALVGVPHCVVGTLSKALGCMGGYVGASHAVIEYLVTMCRGFIYSTGMAPLLAGAVLHAWKKLPHLGQERATVLQRAETLRTLIQQKGYSTATSNTQIVVLRLQDTIHKKEGYLYMLYQILLQEGIKASYIRPPTVAARDSMLRFSCSLYIEDATLDLVQRILPTL